MKIPGRIVKKCMHPTGAQNKRLISNTAKAFIDLEMFYVYHL